MLRREDSSAAVCSRVCFQLLNSSSENSCADPRRRENSGQPVSGQNDVGQTRQNARVADRPTHLRRHVVLAHLVFEVADEALHVVAAPNVLGVPALERRELRLQVHERHRAQLAQGLQRVVRNMALDNQANVLHLRGAEP